MNEVKKYQVQYITAIEEKKLQQNCAIYMTSDSPFVEANQWSNKTHCIFQYKSQQNRNEVLNRKFEATNGNLGIGAI